MDAVTYPEQKVVDYIMDHLLPVRIPFNHERYSKEYSIEWTPTLIVLDSDGKEATRSTGFLSPDELIAFLHLAIGRANFATGNFEPAIKAFDYVAEQFPKSAFAPEAIYYRGVARYKHTKDAKPLREVYDRLSVDYPEDQWTKKSYPYRLIA